MFSGCRFGPLFLFMLSSLNRTFRTALGPGREFDLEEVPDILTEVVEKQEDEGKRTEDAKDDDGADHAEEFSQKLAIDPKTKKLAFNLI